MIALQVVTVDKPRGDLAVLGRTADGTVVVPRQVAGG
jgi:hypothetical protein